MKYISEDDHLITCEVMGYALNTGPVPTKTPIFGMKRDWAYPECVLVLCNCFGSGMWVRYRRENVKIS